MQSQNEQQKQPISPRTKSQLLGISIWAAFIFAGWLIGYQAGLSDGRYECSHPAESQALAKEYGPAPSGHK